MVDLKRVEEGPTVRDKLNEMFRGFEPLVLTIVDTKVCWIAHKNSSHGGTFPN